VIFLRDGSLPAIYSDGSYRIFDQQVALQKEFSSVKTGCAKLREEDNMQKCLCTFRIRTTTEIRQKDMPAHRLLLFVASRR